MDALLAAVSRALRKPMTLMYPDVEEQHPPGYRGIIVYNYDKCIACSLCARICPPRAIKMHRVPGDKKIRPGYDMGRCIFCGYCVDICPTEALSYSWVHDKAFYRIEEMVFDPIDWAKYSRQVLEEQKRRESRHNRVRVVIDEEVGLRYEPAHS